jgi:hypothetical protein
VNAGLLSIAAVRSFQSLYIDAAVLDPNVTSNVESRTRLMARWERQQAQEFGLPFTGANFSLDLSRLSPENGFPLLQTCDNWIQSFRLLLRNVVISGEGHKLYLRNDRASRG